MLARITAVLALVATAQFAMADNAKPRGGGGGSSSAGSHHSSSSAHSSSSGSSGSSASSGSSHVSTPMTDAQRRHPRAGTGSAYRYRYYNGYPYYRGYYNPYYYGYGYYPYSDFYFDGGYNPYYYGSGYGYGYGYHRGYRYGEGASLRVMVEPDEARVYVDGYYAGIVDDFDGLFQRLNVRPGRHEITLKLEGFRTHRMRIYVPAGDTMKLHYHMIKGTGEDAVEDLAGDRDTAADRDPARSPGDDRYDEDDDADRDEPPARDDDRPAARGGDRPAPDDRGEHGELKLSVRPPDASVYVDGQFRGTGRQAESLVVSPGRHRLEVVRPGFRTFEREVQVDDDHPAEVDVELERP